MRREETGNLAIATFRHATSRAQDPQLHTHAVILNATQDKDGNWRSLEPRAFYQLQKETGAIYRQELAHGAAQLGYRIEAGKDAMFEIAGVPHKVIEALSQRTAAIDARLAERGTSREEASAAEKQIAALDTREAKSHADHKTLRADWRATAEANGFGEAAQARVIAEAEERAKAGEMSVTPEILAARAVAWAAAKLSERQAVFPASTLAREAGDYAIGTRKAYRGVNVLALWASSEAQDFGHGLWATYRQWQSLGAQVRKGEKASPIVFYKVLDKPEGSEDEAREGAGRIFAQGSHVFNIAQVDGYGLPEVPESDTSDPIPDVEAFIAATGAAIRIQGDSAHYTPSTDMITMPDRERFFATTTASAEQNWYAILLHELVHWTGADHRLARTFGKRFGDEAYAMEELVAELGSAFLCGDLGLSVTPRQDHACYLASWLKVLKGDNRAIFTAASAAAKAAECLS